MRHTLAAPMELFPPAVEFFPVISKKDAFRERFRCALLQCVRRGFQVEECFGLIWDETVEEVDLSFRDQNEMFPELISWAKRWVNEGARC